MTLSRVRVGGAALNQIPLDWTGNRRRIEEATSLAKKQGVQVLCLPELCLTGYGCEDAFHAEWVAAQALDSLLALAPATQGMAVAMGLPLLHQGRLYNTVALVVNGQVAALAAKKVLAGAGVYYEPRWFSPWPAGKTTRIQLPTGPVPLGDVRVNLGELQVAFEICEEAWGRDLTQGGWRPAFPQEQPPDSKGQAPSPQGHAPSPQNDGLPDVILNPSASCFALGKHHTVENIVVEGSRQSRGAYVFANLLGNEAGRLIFDGTVLVASGGKLTARGPSFSFQPVTLTTAWVDVRANRLERRRLGYPEEPESAKDGQGSPRPWVLQLPALPESPDIPAPAPAPAPEPHEAFARAVALGLWDTLRKTKSGGYAVSLSGGVDSAAVAVLAALSLKLALAELGAQGVAQALEHLPDLPNLLAAHPGSPALVNRLLTTVYQSTENSSPTTRAAAAGVAQFLGTRHLEWDVGRITSEYRALAEQALGRPLAWQGDDLALQNIQARVRSPGLWLLANLEGRLVLATSNRSEAATGYCTMDGDTSGGLAPIAGVGKTFLREWLAWMETSAPAPLGPVPPLAAVNRQAPTAELRPPAAGQTDEADLMPYPVLDAIEQSAIRHRMSPRQAWERLLTHPPAGFAPTPRQAADWVARFYRLWSASQWKRERLAPSFHLDEENVDPKTWCRFPILSAGFAQELEELRKQIET
ncbi:MAG: NAD(+) synthase [Deltaproteobacteria bacterium]|nr:NAD(+) synthase [Deltaproteobacteria bacterium]